MEEELKVPITFCIYCKKDMPVYTEAFDFNASDAPEELKGEIFEAVICPICENILNLDGDVELRYYNISDIQKVTDFKGDIDERRRTRD